MKVGSTDEFLLLLHYVPVLFTTITFFPWHYKTFCQISRSRVSSINNRPKMTFDDAGAKADQEFDLMKDHGVQSQDRHLLFCPPSLPPLPNKFQWGHRAGGQVYGGQQGGQDQRRVRGERNSVSTCTRLTTSGACTTFLFDVSKTKLSHRSHKKKVAVYACKFVSLQDQIRNSTFIKIPHTCLSLTIFKKTWKSKGRNKPFDEVLGEAQLTRIVYKETGGWSTKS